MVFKRLKKAFSDSGDSFENEYIEIDVGKEEKDEKVIVKFFKLNQYEDVNSILNALREGYTIAMIDVKKLRQRDSIELKRAVSKIKKTVDALEGSIAGVTEDIIVATPSFAKIAKEPEKTAKERAESY